MRQRNISRAEEIANTKITLNPGNRVTYPSAGGEFIL